MATAGPSKPYPLASESAGIGHVGTRPRRRVAMMLSAWASTQSGVMASTPARTRASDAFTNGIDADGSWSRPGCEPGYLSALASV